MNFIFCKLKKPQKTWISFFHFYSDTFTESDRFTFCFLTVFLKNDISKRWMCHYLFFGMCHFWRICHFWMRLFYSICQKKTNTSLKSDWFIWMCHFLWHIHLKVTHSKLVEIFICLNWCLGFLFQFSMWVCKKLNVKEIARMILESQDQSIFSMIHK